MRGSWPIAVTSRSVRVVVGGTLGPAAGGAPLTLEYDTSIPGDPTPPVANVHMVFSRGFDDILTHLRKRPEAADFLWEYIPIGATADEEGNIIEPDPDTVGGRWPSMVGHFYSSQFDEGLFPAVAAELDAIGDIGYREFYGDHPFSTHPLSNWGVPVDLGGSGRTALALVNPVVGSGTGLPAVAWTPAHCSSPGQLRYREGDDYGGFHPTEMPTGAASACGASLAFDDNRDPYVAFEDRSEDAWTMLTSRQGETGTSWDTPELIGVGFEPTVVFDTLSRVVTVVYYDIELDALVAVDGVWT